MKRRSTAFLVTMAFLLGANAQLLQVKSGEFQIEEPHFNQEFMARNGIFQILGRLSTKKQMEPIRQKSEHYHYEFDSSGNMVLQMSMLGLPGSGKDTSIVSYEYSDEDRVMVIRRNDPYGFFSYHYDYDAEGRPTQNNYYRDQNLGPNRYQFEQGESFEITGETYGYRELSPGLVEKKFFNNYGDPFKKEEWKYDTLGYLVEVSSHFMISNRRSVIRYKYDETGRPVERTTINDLARGDKDRIEYTYDEIGLLFSQKIYRNDEHVKLIEYLYDMSTMLLKAELTKVMDNNFIRIIQYEYVFQGDPGTGVADSE